MLGKVGGPVQSSPGLPQKPPSGEGYIRAGSCPFPTNWLAFLWKQTALLDDTEM